MLPMPFPPSWCKAGNTQSKWCFNQDHHPNLTVGGKKHLNKGNTEVWKALGTGYKLILKSGEELNQKNPWPGWAGSEQRLWQSGKVTLFFRLPAISSLSNALLSLICTCLNTKVWYCPSAHLCSLITSLAWKVRGSRRRDWSHSRIAVQTLISSAHHCPSSHRDPWPRGRAAHPALKAPAALDVCRRSGKGEEHPRRVVG